MSIVAIASATALMLAYEQDFALAAKPGFFAIALLGAGCTLAKRMYPFM